MTVAAPGPDAIVVLAQVLLPYGVQGWVKLRTYSEAPDAVLDYPKWWIRPAGKATWSERALLAGRVHSGVVVAHLEGIDDRDAALAIRGAEIGVARAAMPPLRDDEFYWTDLIGFAVVNRDGVALGQVAGVQEFGAHPVLRVAPGGEARQAERLIPFVPAHVDRVDKAAGRIDVDWPQDF